MQPLTLATGAAGCRCLWRRERRLRFASDASTRFLRLDTEPVVEDRLATGLLHSRSRLRIDPQDSGLRPAIGLSRFIPPLRHLVLVVESRRPALGSSLGDLIVALGRGR